MKIVILASLAFLLSGCISTEHSSDRKNQQIAAANPDGVVCKREKPTGSHRSIKICRTVEQIALEQKEAKEMSRQVRDQSQIN